MRENRIFVRRRLCGYNNREIKVEASAETIRYMCIFTNKTSVLKTALPSLRIVRSKGLKLSELEGILEHHEWQLRNLNRGVGSRGK